MFSGLSLTGGGYGFMSRSFAKVLQFWSAVYLYFGYFVLQDEVDPPPGSHKNKACVMC